MLPEVIKQRSSMQQMDQHSLSYLAHQFLSEAVVGRSHLTYEIRKRDLKRFLEFYIKLNGNLSVKECSPRDSKLFEGSLSAEGLKPNTINRIMSSLRSFGTWLIENGHLKIHPCKNIRELKVDLGPPKSVDDRSYHRLVKTAIAMSESPKTDFSQNFRDYVMLVALNGTALRITELLSLKLSQFYGKKFVGVFCKGGKVRTVTFKQEVADLVAAYIEEHRTHGSDYIFTSKSGCGLDRVSAWKALKKIARMTSASFGNEPVELSPHRLRHRHAYQCRLAKDPVFAASRLGHSSLAYIQRYSQETAEEQQDLIEKIE